MWRRCPGAAIAWVELCDADAEIVGTMYEDTVHNRRLPGEGAFDVPGFIRAIRATGYDGGYGVEIIAKAQRALPPETAAQDRLRRDHAGIRTRAPRRGRNHRQEIGE